MQTFLQWLEVVSTVLDYLPDVKDAARPTKRRDGLNFPFLDKPGFKAGDITKIREDHPKVEAWLDKATAKFGVHWLILYVPPKDGTPTIDGDEDYAMAIGKRRSNELGKKGWDQYEPYSRGIAKSELDKFLERYKDEGADLNNTIVYIKPTSRVHGLDAWQQTHNIGHGILDYAKEKVAKQAPGKGGYLPPEMRRPKQEATEQGGGQEMTDEEMRDSVMKSVAGKAASTRQLRAKFVNALRNIIYELQQKQYDATGRKPNWVEMVLMLGRVFKFGATFRRIFTAQPGQLDTNWIGNTAFNAKFQEALYDMMAIYINAGGKFSIETTGGIEGTQIANRAGDITQQMKTAFPARSPTPTMSLGNEPEIAPDTRPGTPTGPHAEISRKFPDARPRDWVYKPLASDKAAWTGAVAKLEDIMKDAFQSVTWGRLGGPIYSTTGYIGTGA